MNTPNNQRKTKRKTKTGSFPIHHENYNMDKDTTNTSSSDDKRLNRLEALSENLSNGLNQLSEDVKVLFQVLRDSHKTNWGVMATWAGVLLMLLVAMGNGYIGQPLANLKKQTDSLTDKFGLHISDGHPATVLTQLKIIEKDLATLDTDTSDGMLVLHANIQRDMSTLGDRQDLNIVRIERELLRLRNWKENTGEKFINTISTFQSTIDNLQNKINILESSVNAISTSNQSKE